MQNASHILLVRPAAFRGNEQTAVNNYFQANPVDNKQISQRALLEFDQYTSQLKAAGIQLTILQDPGLWDTPDSIFPNNCISFHQHFAIEYPMFAENRRRERKLDYLRQLEKQGLHYPEVLDFTVYEKQGKFLEGTGVMILDREHKIAYCAISPRSDKDLFALFCQQTGYQGICFQATQTEKGLKKAIYHTNVMLSIGQNFAVICSQAIEDKQERTQVLSSLQDAGKTIIEITEEQMRHFCGNILEVQSNTGKVICMSSAAFNAFRADQKDTLERFSGKIIHSDLQTIEKYGGGSARCMMAEIF